jgi:hypothetical protein
MDGLGKSQAPIEAKDKLIGWKGPSKSYQVLGLSVPARQMNLEGLGRSGSSWRGSRLRCEIGFFVEVAV